MKRMGARGWVRALVVLLVLVLVGAACGDDDDDTASSDFERVAAEIPEDRSAGEATESSDGASEEVAAEPAATEEATEAPAEEPTGAPAEVAPAPAVEATEGESDGEEGALPGGVDVPTNLRPDDLGRDIIRTADITVEVPSVVAATQQAMLAVSGLGGYLFDQQTQTEPEPLTVLTFKVLPEDFDAARSRLGELGNLRQELVSAEDVTDRVVDLRSRITTAEISVERLRGFLEAAPDLDAIARLEQQLLERETTLEELRGTLRSLEDRVSLATIVVTLTQTPEEVPESELELVRLPIAGDAGDDCPSVEGPRDDRVLTEIDADTQVTFCYQIRNAGESTLADLTLDDAALDVTLRDLAIIEGEPDENLAPGDRVVLAYTTIVATDVNVAAFASAVPVDGDDNPIADTIADEDGPALNVRNDDSLPGFTDALSGSWGALKTIGSVCLLVLAAVIPFLPLLLLAAGGVWFVRRRRLHHGGDGPELSTPDPEPLPSGG